MVQTTDTPTVRFLKLPAITTAVEAVSVAASLRPALDSSSPLGINPIVAVATPAAPLTAPFGPLSWPYADQNVTSGQYPPTQVSPSWTIQKEQRLDTDGSIDSFFVVLFSENGTVGVHGSTGDSGGGATSLLMDDTQARGWFLTSFTTTVRPLVPTADGSVVPFPAAVLRSASPTTDNSSHTESLQMIASTSYSATVGCNEQGPSGSVTYSQDNQTWSGNTWTVQDFGWALTEDTSAVQASWTFDMLSPYAAADVIADFASRYAEAFDSSNNVYEPPPLAKDGMTYGTQALFGIPDNGASSLIVRFSITIEATWAVIASNTYGPTGGHHQASEVSGGYGWITDIDLAGLWNDVEQRDESTWGNNAT